MKRTGWARGGSLTVGNRAAFISMSAELEEPAVFTIQFDVQAEGITCFARAGIDFTVNGVTISRVIDLAAGATISGLAEAVRVVILDDTDIVKFPASKGATYGVTMSAAVFPRAGCLVPPVRTALLSEVIVPAGSVLIPVVPGASGVIVYGNAVAGGPATLRFQQYATGTPDPTHLIATTEVTSGQIVPLLSGAGQIQVTNEGAGNANITVVYVIDG